MISDNQEILNLFDHVLQNNKYEKEIKNSIIFKKVLFQTNSENEQELLSSIKPLINTDSIWKPHTLLLVGDYFFSRNEHLKAKEFYVKILNIKNLQNELYEQARSRIAFIPND